MSWGSLSWLPSGWSHSHWSYSTGFAAAFAASAINNRVGPGAGYAHGYAIDPPPNQTCAGPPAQIARARRQQLPQQRDGALPQCRTPLRLQQLAWQVQGSDELTPREALGIYERNWRHLDEAALLPRERSLIDALRLAFGGTETPGAGDV